MAHPSRYLVCDEIASGGMGTVHFGRLMGDAGFARTVAVKKLHPQFAKAPEFVAMLLDEARISGRVRHPNVVPTLDVVSEGGELLVVMEYVHGESVARLAAAQRSAGQGANVPPAIAVAIVVDTLHGLQAAHEATSDDGEPLEIVHRDVSPQNVMVGSDGRARVVDFGVAKAAGRLQTTSEGQVKGKVGYMAPEQLRGRDVDARTDVYSVGVVLWEMLVGARLFSADSAPGTATLVLEKAVDAPSRLQKGVPAALDAIVLQALARDPSRRFANAREMASALEAALVSASPSVVGSWVRETAALALETRSRQIRRLESGRESAPSSSKDLALAAVAATDPAGGSTLRTHTVPDGSRRPLGGTSSLVLGGLLLVVVTAATVTSVTRRMVKVDPASASAPPSAAPAPQPPANVAAVAVPTTSASAVSEPPPPALPSAAPASPTAPPSANPSGQGRRIVSYPSRARSCTPPYTVDRNGFHIPRPECL